MKIFLISVVVSLTLIFGTSCEKDNTDILYPEEGIYGENILQDDSVEIKHSEPNSLWYYYSVRAELPEGTSLKVVMTHTGNPNASWSYLSSTRIGWSIEGMHETYPRSQQFVAYGPVACDLRIEFLNTGSAEITIYENKAETPTRTKSIAW
ncbi:MAG: hypothetical protein JXB24_14445 [Bacteroidales bacterium]|nr:hypothetical protein [Bacteroidales bacterium]